MLQSWWGTIGLGSQRWASTAIPSFCPIPFSPTLNASKWKGSQGQRQLLFAQLRNGGIKTVLIPLICSGFQQHENSQASGELGLTDQVLCKFNHEKTPNAYLIKVGLRRSSGENTSFQKALALQMTQCKPFSTKSFSPEPTRQGQLMLKCAYIVLHIYRE